MVYAKFLLMAEECEEKPNVTHIFGFVILKFFGC